MSEQSLTAEVPERDATGRVATIYSDIRQQLPIVNLIWRHLATRPDALEWAWSIAQPLYATGSAAQSAAGLTSKVALPELPAVSPAVKSALGLSEADLAAIEAMFRTYNRGNGLNLIALSAVLGPVELVGTAAATELHIELVAEAGSELPPLLPLGDLSPDVQELVLELNAMGTVGSADPIVASLYRHLGYWPSYLALAWAQLSPLDAPGRLATAIEDVRTAGEAEALRIAAHRGAAPSGTSAEDVEFARQAIRYFRDTAICRMVAIGLVLSRSLVAAA